MKTITTTVLCLALAAALAGCTRDESGTTMGQRLDGALDRVGVAVASARDSLDAAVDGARTSAPDLALTLTDTALIETLGVADAATAASIKTSLARDPDLRAYPIRVDARNGVVSLKGEIDDQDSRARAEQIARSANGVVRVKNKLRVREI